MDPEADAPAHPAKEVLDGHDPDRPAIGDQQQTMLLGVGPLPIQAAPIFRRSRSETGTRRNLAPFLRGDRRSSSHSRLMIRHGGGRIFGMCNTKAVYLGRHFSAGSDCLNRRRVPGTRPRTLRTWRRLCRLPLRCFPFLLTSSRLSFADGIADMRVGVDREVSSNMMLWMRSAGVQIR